MILFRLLCYTKTNFVSRKKCFLLVRHLQLKKDGSIEVKQRISNFLATSLSYNILRKINFHIKAIKARFACQIFEEIVIFLKYRIIKIVHTSIFTCAHYLLHSHPINNNSPWKLFRPGLNLSNVSMKINESLHTFKASISRDISELTIMLKS